MKLLSIDNFFLFLIYIVLYVHEVQTQIAQHDNLFRIEYPFNEQLINQIQECYEADTCDKKVSKLFSLMSKIANEHSALILYDRAQQLFEDILYYLGDHSPKLRQKVCHILSTLAFAHGSIKQMNQYRECIDPSDLISLRSHAAQSLIIGATTSSYSSFSLRNQQSTFKNEEKDGIEFILQYSSLLESHFLAFIQPNASIVLPHHHTAGNASYPPPPQYTSFQRTVINEDIYEFLLSFLLSETQGGIRNNVKLIDLSIPFTHLQYSGGGSKDENGNNGKLYSIFDDEEFRFRLSVGLGKLGLYDLSLKQLSFLAYSSGGSAAGSSPLFRLRAKLIFPLVPSSLGNLAKAVNRFEEQMESILLHPLSRRKSSSSSSGSSSAASSRAGESEGEDEEDDREDIMYPICSSYNEAALALQALPLLHWIGFSAPRVSTATTTATLSSSSLTSPSSGGQHLQQQGPLQGHLPIPLPLLLGEVYQHMCLLVSSSSSSSSSHSHSKKQRRRRGLYNRLSYLDFLAMHYTRRNLAIIPSYLLTADYQLARRRIGGEHAQPYTIDREDEKESNGGIIASYTVTGATAASSASSSSTQHTPSPTHRRLHIGIVAGSFDGIAGRIIFQLLSSLPSIYQQKTVQFTAMCFPTPRSTLTDRLHPLFTRHINLAPENKTQVIERIRSSQVDVLLFADAALDARVFALAHERLAIYQAMLYGYGNTLGISTIDFYFIPEMLVQGIACQSTSTTTAGRSGSGSSGGGSSSSGGGGGSSRGTTMKLLPQQLYYEQVILLEGSLPAGIMTTPQPSTTASASALPTASMPAATMTEHEIIQHMKQRYLLDIANNRTHLYLFPATIKSFHPEFDPVLEILFRTDPLAMVILAVMKTGRDALPTTHPAVAHDLLHPAMPIAGVEKLKQRLLHHGGGLSSIAVPNTAEGNSASSSIRDLYNDRIRILPPLDEPIYHALVEYMTAILDPFPVGLHLTHYDVLLQQQQLNSKVKSKRRIPIITAPLLQECTNSHVYSMMNCLSNQQAVTEAADMVEQGHDSQHSSKGSRMPTKNKYPLHLFPTTAEEYGILAVRLAKEPALREQYLLSPVERSDNSKKATRKAAAGHHSHSRHPTQMEQIIHFFERLLTSSTIAKDM